MSKRYVREYAADLKQIMKDPETHEKIRLIVRYADAGKITNFEAMSALTTIWTESRYAF